MPDDAYTPLEEALAAIPPQSWELPAHGITRQAVLDLIERLRRYEEALAVANEALNDEDASWLSQHPARAVVRAALAPREEGA